MSAIDTDELYWDPYDIEIDTSPYGIWRRLRDEAPLYRNDKYDFWALSRFDDVEMASKDPATFSSAYGTVLEIMMADPYPGAMMIFRDPPDHTRLRLHVSRAFTPRRVSGLEPHIRELCAELLAPWHDGADFDFVADFGAHLPSMVISELFGVPMADRVEVKDTIDQTFHLDPEKGMVNDVSLTAQIKLHGYLGELVEERRANPGDDLLSALCETELTDEELCGFGNLLVSAGTETVARLLGWAAVTLDRERDQRAELAADSSLLPNAVEELLRYEAPSPVQARRAMRDVELHGRTVPEGSKVALLTGSAGRDERRYPDPDRFDIHRRFDHHLSFGYGIHFCVGAALARLEGRIAIEEALARHPDFEVDHERAVRLHTSTVRGWSSVPVR